MRNCFQSKFITFQEITSEPLSSKPIPVQGETNTYSEHKRNGPHSLSRTIMYTSRNIKRYLLRDDEVLWEVSIHAKDFLKHSHNQSMITLFLIIFILQITMKFANCFVLIRSCTQNLFRKIPGRLQVKTWDKV